MIARFKPKPRTLTIDHALRDQHLLGAALGDAAPWDTWLTVLRAALVCRSTRISARCSTPSLASVNHRHAACVNCGRWLAVVAASPAWPLRSLLPCVLRQASSGAW